MTRISILGLGYVGCVCAGCFADAGHQVIGVDVNPDKVRQLNDGQSPVVEPGLAGLIRRGVAEGRLSATDRLDRAVAETDLSMICVGTPSKPNGDIDLAALERVAADIGAVLARKEGPHEVVVRSTSPPGTAEGLIERLASETGRPNGDGWSLVVNPEFLREGSALADFANAPITVIGAESPDHGARAEALYAGTAGRLFRLALREAEMIKYACNAFHALKITFSNEIGQISRSLGIDSWRVMETLCADRVLNISDAYLRPGFAFGGSCLPKDVRALTYRARRMDLDLPLINGILPSNDKLIRSLEAEVLATGLRRVSVFGLSFKKDTDDLRESPMVRLCETLLGKGVSVSIHDPVVNPDRLTGANRRYIDAQIPHLTRFLKNGTQEALAEPRAVVIATAHEAFADVPAALGPDSVLFDLVRMVKDPSRCRARYRGIAWG